jgi:hypothetical protein
MENFLIGYGVNTLASVFDLTTTAILHKKTGNPNEFKSIRKIMNEKGPFKALLEGESVRRIGYLALALTSLGGEKLFTLLTHEEAFPVHDLILYGSALLYATAGLFNLIPIVFNKGTDTDIY